MKTTLIDPLPISTSSAFNPASDEYWDKAQPAQLNKHIVEVHLDPNMMRIFGIPNFDLEVAHIKGFTLKHLANKIYSMLKDSISNFQLYPISPSTTGETYRTFIDQYKTDLIKTLLYIDQLQPETVDWEKVASIKPEFRKTGFVYQRDCRDASFVQQLQIRQQLASAIYDGITGLFQL